MLTAEEKAKIIKQFSRAKGDTGSPEVQVALLTQHIKNLTEHFQRDDGRHRKDTNSRRGLILMVGQRNRLLQYLATRDEKRYQELIKTLGIRK